MSLILDPSEVADVGRVELDLWGADGPLYVDDEGIDWGDTALDFQKGVGKWGENPIDYRVPNRIITVPLIIKSKVGGDTMIQAMGKLQAKVSRFATEGGTIKRTRKSMKLFADVVSASVTIPDTWTGENKNFESEGQLVLECLPDFYGEEITVPIGSGSANGVYIGSWPGNGANAIKGNYPGRCRITMTDSSSGDHRGVGFAFRSRNYSSSATAQSVYEAEALGLLDQSFYSATPSGGTGSGNNTIRNTALAADWTPVAEMKARDGNYLTHVGVYRVFARVQSVNIAPYIKLSWTQGDLIGYNDNPVVKVPGSGAWYLVDLGEVRLDKPSVGNPRWYGTISAYADADNSTPDIAIDRVFLQCRDESAGLIYDKPSRRILPSGYSIKDPFAQSAGNLVGKTAVPSGTYSALITGGTDFSMDTANQRVQRAGVGATNGLKRADGVALSLDSMGASIETYHSQFITSDPPRSGLLLKASANNYITIEVSFSASGVFTMNVYKTISGTTTLMGTTSRPGFYTWNKNLTISGFADNTGYWEAGFWDVKISGYDPQIASLSGGAYFTDYGGSPTQTMPRYYDNFLVYRPINVQSIYSGRSLILDTKECLRMAADGNGYGPVVPIGDTPRIPVAGKEQRTLEMFLFSTQSDFSSAPDSAIRNFSATLKYRPCWLSVPEA